MNNIKNLNLSNKKIKNLDNIFIFEKLIGLDLSENLIKNISALNKCKKIERLDLSENLIEEINKEEFNDLKNLKILNLYLNKLKKIEINEMPSLSDIDLENNKLEEVRFSNLPKLNFLDCSKNPIKKIYLDNCKEIKRINLSQNRSIKNLEQIVGLNKLKKIEGIDIYDCRLSSINNLTSPKITHLDLSSNNFKNLKNTKEKNSFPKNLVNLDLSNNKLESLEGIEIFSKLKILRVTNNTKLKNITNINELKNLKKIFKDNTASRYFLHNNKICTACDKHNSLIQPVFIEEWINKEIWEEVKNISELDIKFLKYITKYKKALKLVK